LKFWPPTGPSTVICAGRTVATNKSNWKKETEDWDSDVGHNPLKTPRGIYYYSRNQTTVQKGDPFETIKIKEIKREYDTSLPLYSGIWDRFLRNK
jgi:hypothetical protein